MDEVTFSNVAPVIGVRDLDRALRRYRSLGFSVRAYDGPERYGFVERDGVKLHLSESAGHDRRHDGAEIYFYVSDADALFEAWSSTAVKGRFIPPHDTPYGLREFAFVDRDGTAHRVGSPLVKVEVTPDGRSDAPVANGAATEPDNTAVRTALWRAMHVQVDAPPHVLKDEIGLQLAAPAEDWRDRGDMHPAGTSPFRAAIVARARFIEDLVVEQAGRGVAQYVILGAGLDTFAQRRPEMASRLRVFEVDQPGTQAWKRRRLNDLGFGVPGWLRLVPFDFEEGASWWEELAAAGFDPSQPAVVVSTGVTMYLTKAANEATLRELAALAAGSTVATTFLLPIELLDDIDRPGLEMAERGARAAGTPFVSFYTPDEMLALARDVGFDDAQHVAGTSLAERYFSNRTDGLRPSSGEDLLIAKT